MGKRHATAHCDHFEQHGWVLIERLLETQEIERAYPGLFELYPTPEIFHSGDPDPMSSRFDTRRRRRLTRVRRGGSGHCSSPG